MPLSSHRRRRDNTLIETFTKSMSDAEISAGFSPTFGGALAWLNRHTDELNTALRLVQMYPMLIKEDCLDGLWAFIQPMLYGCSRSDRSQFQHNNKAGSWDSGDLLPLSPSSHSGHGQLQLLAPLVKPSMSVHGLDTLGVRTSETRATSASATVPAIVPRSPSMSKSLPSHNQENTQKLDMRKRALSCGSPVGSRRRGVMKHADSGSSSSSGRTVRGSGHTSPDETSVELPHKEEINLPPIPNIENLQNRLAKRKQSLRRQNSIGYKTGVNDPSTDTPMDYSSGYDSRGMTPSMTETAYLVFRKSLQGSELVHFPLKVPEARRDSWMINFWDDDSEASLALDGNVTFDADLRSASVTPDLF